MDQHYNLLSLEYHQALELIEVEGILAARDVEPRVKHATTVNRPIISFFFIFISLSYLSTFSSNMILFYQNVIFFIF